MTNNERLTKAIAKCRTGANPLHLSVIAEGLAQIFSITELEVLVAHIKAKTEVREK